MPDFKGCYDQFIILNADDDPVIADTVSPLARTIGSQGFSVLSGVVGHMTGQVVGNLFLGKFVQLFQLFDKTTGWYEFITGLHPSTPTLPTFPPS